MELNEALEVVSGWGEEGGEGRYTSLRRRLGLSLRR